MADLTTNFAGIRCPNPFWLASGPPTNCGEQIMRAFDAGWGGAVWKTIGEPIVNVSSRYSSVDWNGQRMMGLNNIELITDRPIEVNLREIAEVKKRYPKHAVIASLMVESKRETWHDIVKRSEDAGADGLELNFGCPHGMSERGMGSAVGQVPEYACDDHRVGEGSRAHSRAGQTHPQYHRYPRRRARRQTRRRRRPQRHQHHQLHHRHRSRYLHAAPGRRRALLPWRLLRSGSETHRPAPGAAGGLRPRGRPADFRHRRYRRLARIGRIHAARLRHRTGLHRGHALRLSHRRRYDRRPIQLDGRKRLRHHRRFPRPRPRQGHRVEAPRPELQNRGPHPRRQVHRMRALLYRLLGWRAPVHSPRRAHYAHSNRADLEAASRRASPSRPSPNSGTPPRRALHATPPERIPHVDEEECVGCNLCWLVCPAPGAITMEQVPVGKQSESWHERSHA